MHFMVCHDGSQASCTALTQTLNDLMQKQRGDSLTVAHCWSDEKESYLKFDLKKDYIREQCEAETISLGTKYFYDEEEIIDGENTAKSLLTSIATKRKVDISVVGFHGRKGPKADPTIMGSAVQFMSVNTTQPIMILKRPKRRNQKEKGAYNHALCCDGSAQSL